MVRLGQAFGGDLSFLYFGTDHVLWEMARCSRRNLSMLIFHRMLNTLNYLLGISFLPCVAGHLVTFALAARVIDPSIPQLHLSNHYLGNGLGQVPPGNSFVTWRIHPDQALSLLIHHVSQLVLQHLTRYHAASGIEECRL